MKKWTTLLGLIASALILNCSQALASKRIALEDIPRLVAEKNENVRAAKLHTTAQRERTGYLARSFFPRLSAKLGDENFKTDSGPQEQKTYWKLEASLNLYRGGKDSLENNVRESTANLSQTSFTAEYNKELKEATQAFWNSIAIAQLIADTKEALSRNETNIKSAQKRIGAGITTAADAVQFELYKTSLQRNLRKLENEQDLFLNKLSVALALDEHETLEIESIFPNLNNNKNEAPKLDSENQADVKINRHQQKIEELKSQQSSRWWLPKVDLYSNYGLASLSEDYNRALANDREWATGVRLTLDLEQGFENRKDAAAQRMESETAKLRAAHRQREVIANDHELRHDLSMLKDFIKNSDKDIELALKLLKLTESEYVRGVKNGPDLLEAYQNYFEYRAQKIEHYRKYYETSAELESLVAVDTPL